MSSASSNNGFNEEEPAEPLSDAEEQDGSNEEPSFFDDPSQLLKTGVIVLVLVAAIYIAVPKIAGLDDALVELGKASRWWIGVAVLATVLTLSLIHI